MIAFKLGRLQLEIKIRKNMFVVDKLGQNEVKSTNFEYDLVIIAFKFGRLQLEIRMRKNGFVLDKLGHNEVKFTKF